MSRPTEVRIKRIYDPPSAGDGYRVLVDRLWPRGVKKSDAQVAYWAKDLAPSTELRKWFSHDAAKFAEFQKRYRRELDEKQEHIDELLNQADKSPLTLLYAARDTECNHAMVLERYLKQRCRSLRP